MENRSTGRTSLTAWLERAETARAGPLVELNPMPTVEPQARAAPAVDENGARCTASVVSGQRCQRPAVGGHDLCAGHAAMTGRPDARTSRRRS
jgi:hypothetical protein